MTSKDQPNSRLAILAAKRFVPQPPMHVEDVLADWIERFPKDEKFLGSICKNLNRDKVRRICSKKSKYSTRRKFLAVMLWGYGPYAVGASRALKMTREPNFDEKLQKTLALATGGRHIDAVSFMATNPIKGLGPAYGTKLVYFCSPRRTCAPIYDKRVRDWLKKYAKKELPEAKLDRVQWHTNSYVAWAHWLQGQARLLECN